MIGLLLGVLSVGLAGVLAFYAVAFVLGVLIAPFVWGWRLARFLARIAVVTVIGLYAAAKALAGLAWRVVVVDGRFTRFVVMVFLHVGADLAG